MGEYWKSLPRKFCDMCKCWFADNKASIDFHERGKKHQENAQKRITEIQRKGIKDFKKQKQLEGDMEKIEKAALAAYKKDLLNNNEAVTSPDSAAKLLSSPGTLPTPVRDIKTEAKKPRKNPVLQKKEAVAKKWHEALSEEGNKYYWNVETSETQWEPPTEGFISLKDQEVNKPKTNRSGESGSNPGVSIPISNFGPQPKVDPYGGWVTVEQKVEEEEIDWQLPETKEDTVEVVIPIHKDEPRVRFKEKVIGSLDDYDTGEIVTFKKRKFGGASKRNVRQRTDDE